MLTLVLHNAIEKVDKQTLLGDHESLNSDRASVVTEPGKPQDLAQANRIWKSLARFEDWS